MAEWPIATAFYPVVGGLSQIAAGVATTSIKSLRYFCESQKTALPLHRRKEINDTDKKDNINI